MFVYYFPGERRVTAEMIKVEGLEYALDPGKLTSCQVHGGPDGGAGVVCGGANVMASRVGHFQQHQTWRKCPRHDHWVGLDQRFIPQPEQLLRPEALRGHLVTLGDGNQWLVPVARAFFSEGDELRYYCALPHQVDLDDDGHWVVGDVARTFRHLWDLASKYWDCKHESAVEGDQVTLEFDELHDAALTALAANYRLGKVEAVLLELFKGDAAVQVLEALIDAPTLADLIKKKADTSSGDSG